MIFFKHTMFFKCIFNKDGVANKYFLGETFEDNESVSSIEIKSIISVAKCVPWPLALFTHIMTFMAINYTKSLNIFHTNIRREKIIYYCFYWTMWVKRLIFINIWLLAAYIHNE